MPQDIARNSNRPSSHQPSCIAQRVFVECWQGLQSYQIRKPLVAVYANIWQLMTDQSGKHWLSGCYYFRITHLGPQKHPPRKKRWTCKCTSLERIQQTTWRQRQCKKEGYVAPIRGGVLTWPHQYLAHNKETHFMVSFPPQPESAKRCLCRCFEIMFQASSHTPTCTRPCWDEPRRLVISNGDSQAKIRTL